METARCLRQKIRTIYIFISISNWWLKSWLAEPLRCLLKEVLTGSTLEHNSGGVVVGIDLIVSRGFKWLQSCLDLIVEAFSFSKCVWMQYSCLCSFLNSKTSNWLFYSSERHGGTHIGTGFQSEDLHALGFGGQWTFLKNLDRKLIREVGTGEERWGVKCCVYSLFVLCYSSITCAILWILGDPFNG